MTSSPNRELDVEPSLQQATTSSQSDTESSGGLQPATMRSQSTPDPSSHDQEKVHSYQKSVSAPAELQPQHSRVYVNLPAHPSGDDIHTLRLLWKRQNDYNALEIEVDKNFKPLKLTLPLPIQEGDLQLLIDALNIVKDEDNVDIVQLRLTQFRVIRSICNVPPMS